jgi:hypothetical protein
MTGHTGSVLRAIGVQHISSQVSVVGHQLAKPERTAQLW